MNQKPEPYLIKFEKPGFRSSTERKLEECERQLAELELRVSELEQQAEQNQERKQ